jgi:hypothetical protein
VPQVELSAADLATLVVAVVAGPWGLVLGIALLRGYSVSIKVWRRRQQPDDDAP